MGASNPSDNQSGLGEFIKFLGTVHGDLSTVSAPPFILAPQSLVEFPSYWAERPSLFAAPALEPDQSLRALLILKVWLSALKRQYYIGVSTDEDVKKTGIKKPLNPFLGECFLGEWDDGKTRTKVVSEQVSHHPPTTACYISDEKHGIYAQAHSTQSTSLTSSSGMPAVLVKQSGHALVHIDKYDENYLVPLPDIFIKGFLSGCPYPELNGKYYIISSGFTSEISLSGKSLIKGERNSFQATTFRTDDPTKKAIYTAKGQWNESFKFFEASSGKEIDSFDVRNDPITPLSMPSIEEQDPWETRRAWAEVIDALQSGDFQVVMREKEKVEDAQRAMRKKEKEKEIQWEPEYFKRLDEDPRVQALSSMIKGLDSEGLIGSTGLWRFDRPKEGRRARNARGRGGRDGTSPTG